MTVHIVYPYGDMFSPPRHAAPWSIGTHLAAAFMYHGYNVKQYDWEENVDIIPESNDDILIGHPHDSGYGPFDRAVVKPFKKKYAIAPFNGDETYTTRLNRVFGYCDHLFPICGPYWRDNIPKHWTWKSTPLDMAIEPDHYPFIKTRFNPPGERQFLYIGCTLECKGTHFLSNIKERMPHLKCTHIGPGTIPGWRNVGYIPLENIQGELANSLSNEDFLLSPGIYDANPTTVLEAMAWGLIPLATKRSGWNLNTYLPDNLEQAVEVLNFWNNADNLVLHSVQRTNYMFVREHNWNKFTGLILRVIHGNNSN